MNINGPLLGGRYVGFTREPDGQGPSFLELTRWPGLSFLKIGKSRLTCHVWRVSPESCAPQWDPIHAHRAGPCPNH